MAEFRRQFEMEGEDEASPDRFIIREKIYGRDLVAASLARSEGEHLHYLAAALCGVEPEVLGALDFRDYRALTDLVNTTVGKSTAAASAAPSSEA